MELPYGPLDSTDHCGVLAAYPSLPAGAEPANGYPGGFTPGPGPPIPPPSVFTLTADDGVTELTADDGATLLTQG